jgi:hypothetical protein
MLFEMLTGATPFEATTWEDVDQLRGAGPPPLDVPGLPAPVASVCRRCLAADPAERPSARDLAAALASVGRERGRAWVAAVVAAAVAAALVMTVFLVVRPGSDRGGAGRSAARAPASGPLDSPTPGDGSALGAAASGSPTPPATHASSGTSSPTRAASPAASVLSVSDAANKFYAILDRRAAAGEVRPDVALDLRNQVNSLVANPISPDQRIDNLRRALRDRQREGAVSAAAVTELEGAVADLGTALSMAAAARASG